MLKRQIERIIGQWINGDQTGYCFGFEGPPGIGKTSLAKKGLAYCLTGENNDHAALCIYCHRGILQWKHIEWTQLYICRIYLGDASLMS